MMHYYFQPRHFVGYESYGVGWIVSTIFWAAIVFVVVLLVIKAFSSHEAFKESGAIDVLKLRYAKGEINKKEFEEMKKDLS